MMNRRRFLGTVSASLLAAPILAESQSTKVPRIGLLSPARAAAASGSPYDAFREGLRELGYVEGKNIVLELRFADGYTRLAELAADLVRLQIDVIVTDGGVAVGRAALRATRTIPIVMGTIGVDPVAEGLVASLARPGGNLTGFTFKYTKITGKRLQFLNTSWPHGSSRPHHSDSAGDARKLRQVGGAA
jgi:putative tryptophan/tyrosine transport system substrate-binding protein